MAEKPTSPAADVTEPKDERHAATLAAVTEALDGLRYGNILLTVHDGKVVQLEVTEKQRFS